MTRYLIIRPRDDDDYEYGPTAFASIDVCDHEPRFTGLLDQDGNEIWRDPLPIGFHHPKDGR